MYVCKQLKCRHSIMLDLLKIQEKTKLKIKCSRDYIALASILKILVYFILYKYHISQLNYYYYIWTRLTS